VKLPDFTPQQIKSDVLFVCGVLAAVGLNVSGDLQNAITATVVAALALAKAGTYLADAIIRHGRSRALLNVFPGDDPAGFTLSPDDVKQPPQQQLDDHTGS
jgi:hypothetical protein